MRGINLVVLIWTDGTRRVPVGIKLWRKGGPGRVVLARKLLRWAKWLGVPSDYVIFDSWREAKRILHQLRSYGEKSETR